MQNRFPKTINQLGLFLLIYIGFSVIIALPFIISTYLSDSQQNSWLIAITSLFLNSALIIYYCRSDWKTVFTAPFTDQRKTPVSMILVITITTLFSIITCDPIGAFLHLPDYSGEAIKEMINSPVIGFLTICIMAPLFEEIIFRGIILKGLLQNYSPGKAIFYSAFVFGLIHFNPIQSVGAFLIGLLMGWLYYRSNDLRLTILVHFTNNSLSFFLSKFTLFRESDSFYDILNNNTIYFSALAVSLLGLFICIQYLNKKLPPSLPEKHLLNVDFELTD
ncbi:CPBP family intramembrane metalloprotease [Solitalea sp. MAHUQ-68]|uniref:CPBP family intramembrane metalloprotease n=1 Tax=Solitalea agri TaxID=2953739 RepID=A0A9X2F9J8_9SPHI|nr:type II CAAX endopeptidase family protein [Solitalea agri]MCO4294333.1 CPBP family intramembrane metalloprotease [Solitalea agri]